MKYWWNNRTRNEQILIAGAGAFIIYKIGTAIFGNDKSGGTSGSLSCGSGATYSDNQFKVFADAIETAVWGSWYFPSWTEDDTAIGTILMAMNSVDDICRLNNAYGERYRGVLLQDGGNLAQTIRAYLDQDIKDDVNQSYAARGIAWLWL